MKTESGVRRRHAKAGEAKKCAHCGVALARARFNGVLECNLAFSRRKFCGRACMAASMVGKRKGPMMPRNSRAIASRSAADSCQVCGATGCRLPVHHIDENPLNNAPANLATLCDMCHRRAHSKNYTNMGRDRVSCRLCDAPVQKVGLCGKHLQRLRKHGDPCVTKVKGPGGAFVLVREGGVDGTSDHDAQLGLFALAPTPPAPPTPPASSGTPDDSLPW